MGDKPGNQFFSFLKEGMVAGFFMEPKVGADEKGYAFRINGFLYPEQWPDMQWAARYQLDENKSQPLIIKT